MSPGGDTRDERLSNVPTPGLIHPADQLYSLDEVVHVLRRACTSCGAFRAALRGFETFCPFCLTHAPELNPDRQEKS